MATAVGSVASPVEFNRDIRPILSENCISCHGPDEKGRKAKLRLDVSGADFEEVMIRVTSTDPDEVMPPPKSHKKPLTVAQLAKLRQWIAEGAKYQQHWAFESLSVAAMETIDTLVGRRLAEQGLDFAPDAPRATLTRRVALDLTGLPPTEEMLAKNYEAVVDELLASPHFGEHLAVSWLDAARYADTNGYFGDKPRQMWLWRDWVIDAFNASMPFDQFSIEQLAGDLLPAATVKQRIATGFNRSHMANNETGSIDEEFRVEYVVDRVDTTMTTWLGLTAGCAQCHDHKYDPISQHEFYQLFAFFNNVPEQGLIREDNPPPLIQVPSEQQRRDLERVKGELQAAKRAFEPVHAELKPQIAAWEKTAADSLPLPPKSPVYHESFDGPLTMVGNASDQESGVLGKAVKFDATQHVEAQLDRFQPDAPWTIGLWVNSDGSLGCPLSLVQSDGERRGLELIWQKGRLQVNLVYRWGVSAIEVSTVEALSAREWHHVVVSYDGSREASGVHVIFDGKPTSLEVRRDTLTGSILNAEPLRIGRRDSGLGFYGLIDEVRIVAGPLDSSSVNDWFWGERVSGIVATDSVKRSAADAEALMDFYFDRFAEESTRRSRQAVKSAQASERSVRASIPTTLVMQEMEKPRVAHVLERGQYDKPSAQVSPGVPVAIAPWDSHLPPTRLGFARWLFSPGNSLTARVAANRFWAHCFGEGLVRTTNDFGAQGEAPTHPELLDLLAVSLRESGWNVKALLRQIVLSRTYRQDSRIMRDGDPENRLLARGPSGRLSAEMLRDQALAISGLLVAKVGGPSVKPFQPPGLWEAVSYNGEESYVPDEGAGLWRRSLYTYVKRQAPPPMLLTFDGPTREKCTVRRARTNTPLQALLLMNDQTFVKAAEALAKRSEGQADRIAWMFQAVTARDALPDELELLRGLFARRQSLPLVAHTILNLDETLTKR